MYGLQYYYAFIISKRIKFGFNFYIHYIACYPDIKTMTKNYNITLKNIEHGYMFVRHNEQMRLSITIINVTINIT